MKYSREESKLFAEFLGSTATVGLEEYEMYGIIECIEDGEEEQHFFLLTDMLFHKSWEWLMSVVDEIERLNNYGFDVAMHTSSCIITRYRKSPEAKLNEDIREIENVSPNTHNVINRFDATYLACLSFVKGLK